MMSGNKSFNILNLFVCLLLLSIGKAQGDCYIYGNNSQYNIYGIYCPYTVSWNESNQWCHDRFGTHLVSIHSNDENTAAYNVIDGNNAFIGFNDILSEGTWVWADGSDNSFTYWYTAGGEPNGGTSQDCSSFWFQNGRRWEDVACNTFFINYFICNGEYTNNPTLLPSMNPSRMPSNYPTLLPTIEPTMIPSDEPSDYPSDMPSSIPSHEPTVNPSSSPSLLPSNNPSLTPSNYPIVIPTTNPTQDYSTNYTNTNGCDEIDGGDWILVRRVSEYDNAWHPINDDLKGNETYGVYSSDAQANSTWSINFDEMVSNYNQFLFATGNCDYWLVTNVDQATTKGCLACDRCILNSSSIALSSYGNLPYYAEWYNRDNILGATNEDPWISIHDHIEGASDNGEAEIVYGENAHSINHLIPMIYNNGGNVWIRNNENETRYCGMTHEPSVSPTNNPTLAGHSGPCPTSQPSISPTDDKKEKGTCGDNDEFTYCDNEHYIGVYSNSTNVTWCEALLICEVYFYSSLASIYNAQDNANVKDAALCAGSENGYKWIGLNDIRNDGIYEWVDDDDHDSILNYTNWLVNEPSGNGDCVSFHHQGTWGDNPCDNTYNSFICNV